MVHSMNLWNWDSSPCEKHFPFDGKMHTSSLNHVSVGVLNREDNQEGRKRESKSKKGRIDKVRER